MDKKTLKEITHELDYKLGGVKLNLNTLENARTELGLIAEDIEGTNKADITAMGLTLRDIEHKIMLLFDLMNYTVKELAENIEETDAIKKMYFDLLVKQADGKQGEYGSGINR